MNLRLPLPLRRALLAAMCVLGSQTFAAEYTASTLEEFQTAWNQMADGDTLTITGSIDFEGVELGSLPADASIVLKSDGKGSISNFNYKDMSAVNMQHLNVSGRGTVHVGNMTEGMLSGWDEEGNTLSIENASTLEGTWLVLENNKLVAGDGAVLSRNEVTTGHSASIETRIDPETGALISTVVTATPGEIAMDLGKNVRIHEMDLSMNDGVRGQIVSHGDISLSDSTLISTGAVNTTSVYENEDSGVLIGQSETVGAHGGIDFSAGAVTMQDTNLSTVGGDSQSTGGEILLGDNSTLTAKERAEITTEALVLSQGIARQGEDGTYLPGTSMEETMGLFGDITVGNGSSIENYDMDAQGSIFIGEGQN